MSYIEVTGKTEEEAVRKALTQLGLERDDVSLEILERAKSGFLGIGGSPARIRVTYGTDEPEEKKAEPMTKTSAPEAAQAVEGALAALGQGLTPDAVLSDAEAALSALGELGRDFNFYIYGYARRTCTAHPPPTFRRQKRTRHSWRRHPATGLDYR